MPTLTTLNADCMRVILKLCSMEDHFALLQVSPIFESVVQDLWTLHWLNMDLRCFNGTFLINNSPRHEMLKISAEQLKVILDLVHPYVQSLRLNTTTLQLCQILNGYCFSRVCVLRLRSYVDTALIKACFPNVRKLVLFDETVLKYSRSFDGLKELDVRFSNIEIKKILEFASHLKLKSLKLNEFENKIPAQLAKSDCFNELEELMASAYGIKDFLNNFADMTKLRKLTVNFRNVSLKNCSDLWSMFSGFLDKRVVELSVSIIHPDHFNDTFRSVQAMVQHFQWLRKLTLITSDVGDILEFSRTFPLLRSVYVKNKVINAAIVKTILYNVPQLEYLEFANCSMYKSQGPIRLDVREIAQKRTQPIILNLCQSRKIREEDQVKVKITLNWRSDFIRVTNVCGVRNDFMYEYIFEPI